MRHAIALLSVALLSGCFFSPVGPNNAANPAPTPVSGKVSVSYALPEGVEATKVTFQVEGHTTVTGLDDSTNSVRAAELDVSSLQPGVYTVNVLLDDETEPAARLIVVMPGAAAAEEGTPAAEESPAEE